MAPRLRLPLLAVLTALGPLSIDAYLPAFPAMAADLRTTPAAVQLTLAAYLVALAVGQLAVGTLSDSWGRRTPVVVAVAGYAVASLACSAAPSVGALIGLRAVQGFAGGAAVVVGRALVRDVHAGAEATRYYARLTLVFGLAPVLAPSLGSLTLRVSSWRGIFVLLAFAGACLLVAVLVGLPETLPPQRRRPAAPAAVAATMGGLLADGRFLGYCLAQALAFAGMFAYIAGSPFAVQQVYGASPTVYGLLFGLNAVGLVVAGRVGVVLAGRVPERTALRAALALMVVATAVLLVVTATRGGGLAALAAGLFCFVALLGLVLPNATSLAVGRRPSAAGTASALLGGLQGLLGALAAPLVGLGPAGSAVPMAVVMAGFAAAALAALLLLAPGPEPVATPP